MTGTALEGNFTFTLEKMSGVNFNMQTMELPAVTLTERNVNGKYIDYQDIGEKLIFDKLNIGFMVDEKLENYQKLQDWMWECVNPNKGIQSLDGKLKQDGVLSILDKHHQPIKHYRFHSCFPSIIGPLMYNNVGTTNEHLTCTVTLSYSHYHCEESLIQSSRID